MKRSRVSLKTKSSILHDVGFGLSYLHCRSQPIIHRDLSPNNILLTCDLVAKISDLGVAKVVKADSKMTKSKLTQAPGCVDFMPPEALESCPKYSVSLDIFSYGGIVLHVVNQEWPSPENPVRRTWTLHMLVCLSVCLCVEEEEKSEFWFGISSYVHPFDISRSAFSIIRYI